MKAIQCLLFPFSKTHSEPSNSKTQICTVMYWAAELSTLLRCCAKCQMIIFLHWEKQNYLSFFWRGGQNLISLDRTIQLHPSWFLYVFLVESCCSGHRDLKCLIAFVWEATSYAASQKPEGFRREQTALLLFQLQRLNVFVLPETESGSQMAHCRPIHFNQTNGDLSAFRLEGGSGFK